ncbi:right-handed parallel beta-helix repeat-containing protein [Streptomyces sp.]|uniref:right-handed parallel beta-helix repeat-containing protein n=1 Tax=Streptomyces sp. TaxID=1931 RepID=UPI002D78A714|nr:right-handed parallel beta-helix repeat-containing protein [Streptomyces sp.]HET6357457.1 right-handed parallel beta-helix repeat-containing protein [Streptomyces sp.]
MSASTRTAVALGSATALLLSAVATIGAQGAVSTGADTPKQTTAAFSPLDLSKANRRAAITGLHDWSKAGYRGGENLPGPAQTNPAPACQITEAELATQYGVKPNDNADDSAGLQSAIDHIRTTCSPAAGYTKLSLITMPAGTLRVSRQIAVDADYLTLRGAGSGTGGTRIVFRPDANTRYDALTPDGSDWDEDGMTSGSAKGGWIWPGRGLLRVQSRGVHASYASEYAAAPPNRKDLFEGTVNVHWKSGLKLRGKSGDTAFAARAGDTVVHLATSGSLSNVAVGGLVNIRGANSLKFYAQQGIKPGDGALQNIHMRQQIFTIAAVDTANRTLTLDKPLEYDLPVSSTSDGSAAINGAVYDSKAAPLVDPVLGVGFENFALTQEIPGLDPADAKLNYGNMEPSLEMHGIVFKWAANSWVRGIRAEMTGSHPIVTEEAYHLQIVDNQLDGSWNKGKGGNGYFRGSRVWDSLYAGNTSRNLRHFTFQWSASGNVVIGNDFDSDLNLHGGWERNNLFELNTVTVPYEHRSANCRSNCGEEGGGGPDDSTWFPIWWGAGKKAVKWSGSSGPRNVFFNNAMTKQVSAGAAYTPYYADNKRVYQFGWSGTAWRHLDVGGTPIADWAGREQLDYSGGHGVDANRTDSGSSLFLKSVTGGTPTPTPTPTPRPVIDVSTSAQLTSALAAATPGQTIRMAPGEYRGAFETQRPGTATRPITLTGPRTAVLVNDGPSGDAPSCPVPTAGWDPGYGLWLYGAPHWKLTGFTVKDSKKGVVLDNSHHVTVDGLYVHHVDEEAVHFRRSSADGVIRNSAIEHTGLVQPGYGEGVYVGSANSNWACHGNSGGVDRSDRVLVEDNRIGPYVAAEGIDIKEGTFGGTVRGNTFDGRGITGQNSGDSWVDVKGVDYLIENNTGTFTSPGTFANGYETHNPGTSPSFPNGCGTVWRGNSSDLGGVGDYAIKITSTSKCSVRPNVVYASNTVTRAVSGLTNVAVTP